ncbi:hypothetical protein DL96DRAFT_1829353 [Flagelloscypha sp. PMI_526]|nr:hypothetical protein DL96DRAFT_1829353 [Flagelloscypha sp. PMI_526]
MSMSEACALKANHLRLVLFQKFPGTDISEATVSTTEPALYLDIPITILNSFSPYPRKFLRFLAFAVLGYECTILYDNIDIGDTGDVVERAVYHARSNTTETMKNMIDPEVTARGTSTQTETEHRNDFATQLEDRDYTGIFGATPPDGAAGCHIIPSARGSEWLRLLLRTRLKEAHDNVENLNDINDLRNGFLSDHNLHNGLGAKRIAVIKTPNRILQTTDIRSAVRPVPDHPGSDLSFPDNERYTLHYLGDPSTLGIVGFSCPLNIDAKFKTSTTIPKPAAVLLHYHYGSAVLLQWGNKPKFPEGAFRRPQAAHKVPTNGLSTKQANRLATVTKVEEEARALASIPREPDKDEDGDMEDVPYEEWLMMVLAVNNPETRARLDEEKQAFQSSIQRWAEQVQ